MPDDRAFTSLYELDFDAWAVSQAAVLREAGLAVANGNERAASLLSGTVDWENLAEEIDGLAKRDRRELASRLAVIIEHLVKLEFSLHTQPRAGWIDTVMREREEIRELLEDSPSLYREIPALLERRSEAAIKRAIDALGYHGEILDGRRAGYKADEVVGSWIPGEPS